MYIRKHKPPKLCSRFLGKLLRLSVRDAAIEDFEERYTSIASNKGLLTAFLWYMFHTICLIPSYIKDNMYWSTSMFKNYLKISLRNIKRHKGYSFINITGLAVGIACCLFILLWIQDEVSFNKFHENIDDIYVVVTTARFGEDTITYPGTPPALGPAVKEEYPEILNAARLQNGVNPFSLSYGDKKFREGVNLADPSVLEMLTFPLIQGNPQTALSDPHSLIMSERMAHKYFGNENPIGKIVRIENQYDFKVTGVLKKIPSNSSIRFDFLAPLSFLEELRGKDYMSSWGNLSFRTYVQLQKNIPFESISQKLADRLQREGEEDVDVFLHPFKRLYLYWLDMGGGHIEQVRMFTLIALFVLLIACINFMNLTTARSGNRAKEIGLRKVVGAYRADIIKQYFSESILMSFLSLLFALGLVFLLLPVFNDLVGKELTLNLFGNPVLAFGLIGITLLTGIIAGSYPAFFMAAFKPANILKRTLQSGSSGSRFRKILVVTQFTISITLIIGTMSVFKQVVYMRNRDLGFDKEYLVYVPVARELENNYEAVKHELLKSPDVLNASVTSHRPTGIYWNGSGWDWEGRDPNVNPLVTHLCADPDFLETFKMEMAEGNFYPKGSTIQTDDPAIHIIINERFGKIIGKETFVGERLTHGDDNFIIAGVIKDFHFKPLWEEIGPLIILLPLPRRVNFMFVRINSINMPQTIGYIESVFNKFSPESPFEYRFLDEEFERLYRSEMRTGSIVSSFTILTILVSCLGLFGLASFMAEQRTKEIGIRKVLGSSVQEIVLLLSKQFLKWVLLANLIAWPLAYYFAYSWQKDYAYRAGLSWSLFILAGLLTLAIALITVSFQAIKAACANPVKSLRYE
jgi:putative ABC transport system permease protein